MGKNKRCIFHIPLELDSKRVSASHIRPKKMKEAFENIGYEVDVVWGNVKERKKVIKKVKKNVRDGLKYEFAYSESSTMPTLLTEKHHLPTHPFLDFSFFKFLNKNGIKIGLFYRDMYWKFPEYKSNLSRLKAEAAILMYRYDLFRYNHLLKKLYLSSSYGKQFLTKEIKEELFDYLPPGCDRVELIGVKKQKERKYLRLLYVGGIGNHYRMHKLFECVNQMPDVRLTICCREEEWKTVLAEYEKYMTENIEIVHKSGNELRDLYNNADIGLVFFETHIYMKGAMAYKLFEYLSYGLPIISSQENVMGDFVILNNIGWSIPYEVNSLKELLNQLLNNPELLKEKKEICFSKISEHTWEKRAEKVVTDLTK